MGFKKIQSWKYKSLELTDQWEFCEKEKKKKEAIYNDTENIRTYLYSDLWGVG